MRVDMTPQNYNLRSKILLLAVLFFLPDLLLAEELNWSMEPPPKSTIAVIDFIGDSSITTEQLSVVAGKVSQNFANTGQFVLLDRSRIDVILREQGFQQSGSCSSSECRVEIGQMLGVEYLVAGKIVQFGSSFVLGLEYIDVETGEIKATIDAQQEGELIQVLNTLCKSAVQDLTAKLEKTYAGGGSNPSLAKVVQNEDQTSNVDLSSAIPKTQRTGKQSIKNKLAIFLFGSALASTGAGYYFDSRGQEYVDEYNLARQSLHEPTIRSAYNNSQDMETYRNISYSTGAGLGIVALILWFWPEGE